jgi:hypothetical protein
MANLLQSSDTQTSTAPSYYTDYLTNLATAGKTAATDAQYIGAQPLQQQAFNQVSDAATEYKPILQNATDTLSRAANAQAPLQAATPYYDVAMGDLGTAASGLMSPYMSNVVNAIGDTGQRNIQQNLAPQATAAAVGSGQFGSKRGAEVLGQTIGNANRDILNQQYQALDKGYQSALTSALGKQQLEGTLGTNAGTLASTGQQNLATVGKTQADLASTNQALNLADINALATLGGQQQTIAQNAELFPLTNLSTLSGLLRGYNVPISTQKTSQSSPLSVLSGLGATAAGLFTPGTNGISPFQQLTGTGGASGAGITDQLKNWYNPSAATAPGITYDPTTGGYKNASGQATDAQGMLATGYNNTNSQSTSDPNALNNQGNTADTSGSFSGTSPYQNGSGALDNTSYGDG